MDIITAGVLALRFAPKIIGLFQGDDKGKTIKAIEAVQVAAEFATTLSGKDAIEAMNTASPEMGERFKQSLIKQEVVVAEMRYRDVANARDMQVAALAQDDLFSKRFVYYFAAGLGFMTFLYIFGVTFVKVPADQMHIVNTVTGFLLGTALSSIINYFYGFWIYG